MSPVEVTRSFRGGSVYDSVAQCRVCAVFCCTYAMFLHPTGIFIVLTYF